MSNLVLAPALSCGFVANRDADRTTSPQVIMREQIGVSLCSVLARKGCDEQLANRVFQDFGIQLPVTASHIGRENIGFCWAGPRQWLAVAEGGGSELLEQRLKRSFAGIASVVDQSDGRAVVRISGPRARDALAKGVHIDLHPRAFKPGDTAMTVVAYINVQFWQVDDTPTYDFVMFRSFALSFCEWLSAAASEYDFVAE